MNSQKSPLTKEAAFMSMLLLAFGFGEQLFAEQQGPNEPADFFEMSIEELMEVEVISASRQVQKIRELSVPVSVITAEDIHYSGLTSIPEILQFTPGIDVLRLSRSRYAIGVRGLHDFISDRTLTLVNGRIADSPLFGGSEFNRLPLLIDDIERIEVVRGPGGAAWGANAFTGVINIITKKPEDVLGTLASTTINEFGDSYTHLRRAEKQGKWSWRTSVGYEDFESSDETGAGRYVCNSSALVKGLIGFSGYSANDFMRNLLLDNEAIYNYSDRTNISFGVGYSHNEVGDWEFGGFHPGGNGWYETVRSYAKLDHEFENGATGYLQWFNNYSSSKVPTIMKWHSVQNDIEGQINFKAGNAHNVSMGGNLRFIRINTEQQDPQQMAYTPEPCDEQIAGAFFIDRWKATDRLTFEGQIRVDNYSETQTDWSTRLTSLYAIDEQKDHVLRFSFAKAFRAPLTALRKPVNQRVPLGGGLYLFNVLKPIDDLENEETWSLEAGYTGRITNNLTLRADTYYQRFTKLIGYTTTTIGGLPYYRADNVDGADSWGTELELSVQNKTGKLSTWYAYNDFKTDKSQQPIRAYMPAQHKVGLTGRLLLKDGWTLNTNYIFAGTTPTLNSDSTIFDVGSSHRLDLTIAKEFEKGKGELMFGVSDVFNKTNGPNFGIGQLSAHETPGRTFFVRLLFRF